jgi:hypothetical protein
MPFNLYPANTVGSKINIWWISKNSSLWMPSVLRNDAHSVKVLVNATILIYKLYGIHVHLSSESLLQSGHFEQKWLKIGQKYMKRPVCGGCCEPETT